MTLDVSVDDSKIYKIWACFEGKENIKMTDDKLYKEATTVKHTLVTTSIKKKTHTSGVMVSILGSSPDQFKHIL